MLGVARGVDHGQEVAVAELDAVAVGCRHHAVRGHGQHPAVQAVQERPVHPRGAVDEARRIDQVPSSALVDHHGGPGEGGGHVTDAPGVVEMDVRDDDPAQVQRAESRVSERGTDRCDTAL